jgi:hypothetical protein
MLRQTLTALFACLTLAACGADGAPDSPAEPGVALSGEARLGVVVK